MNGTGGKNYNFLTFQMCIGLTKFLSACISCTSLLSFLSVSLSSPQLSAFAFINFLFDSSVSSLIFVLLYFFLFSLDYLFFLESQMRPMWPMTEVI